MKRSIIICVDDEPAILETIEEYLHSFLLPPHVVEVAESGEEALEIIDEAQATGDPVPLIISDQVMPGMSGDQLLIEVQARSPQTRKVLLTGQARLDDVARIINQTRLFRYIAKPWQPEDLKLTVETALQSYLQESELSDKNERIKEINRRLQEQNQQLEALTNLLRDKANKATQDLNEERKEAQHMEHMVLMRGQIINAISQEHREHLHTISAALTSIQTQLREPQPNIQIKQAEDAVSQLLAMLDRLRELSMLEEGKIKLGRFFFSIRDLLCEVKEEITQLAQRKGLEFQIDLDPALPACLYGDPMRIREMVLSLAENAVRYSHQGTICLSLQRQGTDEEPKIRFQVEDQGIGIPQKRLAALFTPFAPANHMPDNTKKLGMSLAIVNQLATLMDAPLRVESAPGAGSRFWFDHPLETDEHKNPISWRPRSSRRTAPAASKTMPTQTKPIVPRLVPEINSQLLHMMKEAAELGDIGSLDYLLAAMPKRNDLKTRLELLLSEYDLQAIVHLIDKFTQTTTSSGTEAQGYTD